MDKLTESVAGVPPCAELRAWFAERLRLRLVEAVRLGHADAASVAQLELDVQSMIEGAAPCREDRPPGLTSAPTRSG